MTSNEQPEPCTEYPSDSNSHGRKSVQSHDAKRASGLAPKGYSADCITNKNALVGSLEQASVLQPKQRSADDITAGNAVVENSEELSQENTLEYPGPDHEQAKGSGKDTELSPDRDRNEVSDDSDEDDFNEGPDDLTSHTDAFDWECSKSRLSCNSSPKANAVSESFSCDEAGDTPDDSGDSIDALDDRVDTRQKAPFGPYYMKPCSNSSEISDDSDTESDSSESSGGRVGARHVISRGPSYHGRASSNDVDISDEPEIESESSESTDDSVGARHMASKGLPYHRSPSRTRRSILIEKAFERTYFESVVWKDGTGECEAFGLDVLDDAAKLHKKAKVVAAIGKALRIEPKHQSIIVPSVIQCILIISIGYELLKKIVEAEELLNPKSVLFKSFWGRKRVVITSESPLKLDYRAIAVRGLVQAGTLGQRVLILSSGKRQKKLEMKLLVQTLNYEYFTIYNEVKCPKGMHVLPEQIANWEIDQKRQGLRAGPWQRTCSSTIESSHEVSSVNFTCRLTSGKYSLSRKLLRNSKRKSKAESIMRQPDYLIIDEAHRVLANTSFARSFAKSVWPRWKRHLTLITTSPISLVAVKCLKSHYMYGEKSLSFVRLQPASGYCLGKGGQGGLVPVNFEDTDQAMLITKKVTTFPRKNFHGACSDTFRQVLCSLNSTKVTIEPGIPIPYLALLDKLARRAGSTCTLIINEYSASFDETPDIRSSNVGHILIAKWMAEEMIACNPKKCSVVTFAAYSTKRCNAGYKEPELFVNAFFLEKLKRVNVEALIRQIFTKDRTHMLNQDVFKSGKQRIFLQEDKFERWKNWLLGLKAQKRESSDETVFRVPLKVGVYYLQAVLELIQLVHRGFGESQGRCRKELKIIVVGMDMFENSIAIESLQHKVQLTDLVYLQRRERRIDHTKALDIVRKVCHGITSHNAAPSLHVSASMWELLKLETQMFSMLSECTCEGDLDSMLQKIHKMAQAKMRKHAQEYFPSSMCFTIFGACKPLYEKEKLYTHKNTLIQIPDTFTHSSTQMLKEEIEKWLVNIFKGSEAKGQRNVIKLLTDFFSKKMAKGRFEEVSEKSLLDLLSKHKHINNTDIEEEEEEEEEEEDDDDDDDDDDDGNKGHKTDMTKEKLRKSLKRCARSISKCHVSSQKKIAGHTKRRKLNITRPVNI